MPTGKESTIKLPSLDELFSSQEERDDAKLKRIYEIPSPIIRIRYGMKRICGRWWNR